MFGASLKLALDPASVQQMQEFAKTFPEKVQKRVYAQAGKVASKAMADRLETLVPKGTKPHGFIGPTQHIRDSAAFSKPRNYKSGLTLFLVGYRSKQNPLQTLLERGNFLTSPRMTRHESKSGRVYVAAGTRRSRERYQLANGSWRWGPYKDVPKKDNRRSTGSRAIGTQGPYRGAGGKFVRGGHGHSTGDFPKSKIPFGPLTKTYQQMRNEVQSILRDEVAKGFERAFWREAGRP